MQIYAKIQDGGGRHLGFQKILIISASIKQFSPNFNPSFVSAPGRRFLGQKSNFAKSKMAAGLRLKFTNMAIAPKRKVRNGPNLAEIIPYGPEI